MKLKNCNKIDKLLLSVFCASIFFFMVSIINAYELTGKYWSGSSTEIDWHNLSLDWAWVSWWATYTWNHSGMDFDLNYDDSSSNDIRVYYDNDGKNGYYVYKDYDGDELEHVHIYLNEYYVTPSYDIYWPIYGYADGQSICTHEIGHFLGLYEEDDEGAVTMYPTYGPNAIWMRSLENDDIDGIEDLYP